MGSEMCIRDSASTAAPAQAFARAKRSSPNNFTRRHKKALPSKGRAFLLSIPKWICRHARNPGPIHPYGLPPVRDSQQFSSRFQRQITIPPTVNSIRPEAPSKGISRKGRNTSDDSGGAVHHRTSKDTCTGILPQTNLSVCRIYLLYLIIEHRNIAGEAYPAMSNACFSP